MRRRSEVRSRKDLPFRVCVMLCAIGFTISCCSADESSSETAAEVTTEIADIRPPSNVGRARDRARLLHEVVRGTLQVVHRDLFDEEDSFAIPSRSLEDVFHELGRRYHVQLRWLNVQTDVLNQDHLPANRFEREAAEQLAAGKPSYEEMTSERYQYAGAIHLKSQCLKCHVKRRISTERRVAGLVITMPVESTAK
ncbi:MAG: c-type heme family protein [Rubripirellula sp.]